MPFTFAHPAAVLPLNKAASKYVSVTGLLIGSVAPDFEYFIRFNDSMHWGHFWWGLFCFDVPVGLVLCFVFHNIVRDELLPNLPLFVQRRTASQRGLNWNGYFVRRWLVVVLSLLAGSALHLLWDGLTHVTSEAILQAPLLAQRNDPFYGYAVYYTVWSLNSLVGFWALARSFGRLPAVPVTIAGYPLKYWGVVAITAFFVTVIRLTFNSDVNIIGFTDTVISATFIGVLLSSIMARQGYLERVSVADS